MTDLVIADKPARKVLEEVVRPHCPKRWTFVIDESAAIDSNRTRVRMAQRRIEPGGTGNRDRHWVTFAITITVPSGDGEAAAEQLLDDDVDALLHALDAAGVPWSACEKGRYSDEGNRLGYQIDTRIYTTKRKAE